MEDQGGQGKARHAAHGAGRVLRKLLFYSIGNVTTGPGLGCAEFGVRTGTSETKQSLVRGTRAEVQGWADPRARTPVFGRHLPTEGQAAGSQVEVGPACCPLHCTFLLPVFFQLSWVPGHRGRERMALAQ